MLKAELIRPRIAVRGSQVSPRLLEADYHWLGVAGELIALFQRQTSRTRAALDEALADYEGDRIDYPIIRGLAAVLANQATFSNPESAGVAPAELRQKLFALGPSTSQLHLFQPKTRAEMMAEVAAAYQLTPAQVEAALFADLAEEQVLQSLGEVPTPGGLIERYNLEVARGILYWAREVQIHVEDRYRDVFKYVKLINFSSQS